MDDHDDVARRRMLLGRFVLRVLLVGAMTFGATVVSGQNYPNKLIRIVASEAGGGGDLAARVIAQELTKSMGQPVVVENRGGGVIAGEVVAKAPPDGYTLLFYGDTFWLLPLMRSYVSYDPIRDFLPITSTVTTPLVLVVNPSVAANSVRELIALARAEPGKLNYSSAAAGTSNHLSAELFKFMAGVDIVRILFKGHASALNAVIGGEAHLMFAIVGPAMAQVKAGKLKGLAVTSAEPTRLAPGLPTLAASGLPGYESVSTFGVFAPAGTPATIIDRLNHEIVRILNRAEIKERFFRSGMETLGSSPEEFAATIKSEIAKWGKVIRDAGIRDQ